MRRLLLFMPTYEYYGVIQAFPAAVKSFYDLETPDGYEVDRVIGLDNPYPVSGKDKHKNTLHQYRQARQMMLDGDYDGLVTLEHDMIVPADGLKKLANTMGDIVYGLYMLRHGAYCVNAFHYVSGKPGLQNSITYKPNLYRRAQQDGVVRVCGVGMGFTLFRRKVMELFDFRASGKSYPPDWGIAWDSYKKGLVQMCRFDVSCGHIDENGVVVYPTLEGVGEMTKVKILKHFVYKRIYEVGQITEVPSDMLDDFLRAGYVELAGDRKTPAVKIVNKPDKKSTKAIKDRIKKGGD